MGGSLAVGNGCSEYRFIQRRGHEQSADDWALCDASAWMEESRRGAAEFSGQPGAARFDRDGPGGRTCRKREIATALALLLARQLEHEHCESVDRFTISVFLFHRHDFRPVFGGPAHWENGQGAGSSRVAAVVEMATEPVGAVLGINAGVSGTDEFSLGA